MNTEHATDAPVWSGDAIRAVEYRAVPASVEDAAKTIAQSDHRVWGVIGRPGTGKTQTLINIMRRAMQHSPVVAVSYRRAAASDLGDRAAQVGCETDEGPSTGPGSSEALDRLEAIYGRGVQFVGDSTQYQASVTIINSHYDGFDLRLSSVYSLAYRIAKSRLRRVRKVVDDGRIGRGGIVLDRVCQWDMGKGPPPLLKVCPPYLLPVPWDDCFRSPLEWLNWLRHSMREPVTGAARDYFDYYKYWKGVNGVYDYADIIETAYNMVRYAREPVITPGTVILVDEAQDLTPLEFALFTMLRENCDGKLVMFGDARQCLDAHRGAVPGMFPCAIKDAKLLSLSRTHRFSRGMLAYTEEFWRAYTMAPMAYELECRPSVDGADGVGVLTLDGCFPAREFGMHDADQRSLRRGAKRSRVHGAMCGTYSPVYALSVVRRAFRLARETSKIIDRPASVMFLAPRWAHLPYISAALLYEGVAHVVLSHQNGAAYNCSHGDISREMSFANIVWRLIRMAKGDEGRTELAGLMTRLANISGVSDDIARVTDWLRKVGAVAKEIAPEFGISASKASDILWGKDDPPSVDFLRRAFCGQTDIPPEEDFPGMVWHGVHECDMTQLAEGIIKISQKYVDQYQLGNQGRRTHLYGPHKIRITSAMCGVPVSVLYERCSRWIVPLREQSGGMDDIEYRQRYTGNDVVWRRPEWLGPVSIGSYHASKGLEADIVFVLACAATITVRRNLQYTIGFSPGGIEVYPFACPLYVAMTRAKHRLVVCQPSKSLNIMPIIQCDGRKRSKNESVEWSVDASFTGCEQIYSDPMDGIMADRGL